MSTEIAPQKPRQLPAHAQLIQSRAALIQEMLPTTFNDAAKERFVSTLVTAVATNPKLAECEQGTLIQAAYRIAQLGLDVGINAYLIPRRQKGVMTCVVDPGFKGWLKIMYDSGIVRAVQPGAIYANESYTANGHVVLAHDRMLDIDARGPLVGTYCTVTLQSGEKVGVLLDMADIQRARRMGADNGPWQSDFVAMAVKTAIMRAAKLVPWKTEVAALVAQHDIPDDDGGMQVVTDKPRRRVLQSVRPLELPHATESVSTAPETVVIDDNFTLEQPES